MGGQLSVLISFCFSHLGECVALEGFTVIDHNADLNKLGERILAQKEKSDQVVITNAGVPKKILTIEIYQTAKDERRDKSHEMAELPARLANTLAHHRDHLLQGE